MATTSAHGFARQVEPEWLDELPAADPGAIHSRRDLRRLNVVMGNAGAILRLLAESGVAGPAPRVIELGAGDGTLLLAVARRLGPSWRGTRAQLVDRAMLVSGATRDGFASLDWELEVVTNDVFADLARSPAREGTLILANLFLHHFERERLRELLALIAARAEHFIACEPRRSRFALAASRCVGLLGCHAITRHDAVVSVRAGFAGEELSQLWPADVRWRLEERSAWPFSHVFAARRRAAVPSRGRVVMPAPSAAGATA